MSNKVLLAITASLLLNCAMPAKSMPIFTADFVSLVYSPNGITTESYSFQGPDLNISGFATSSIDFPLATVVLGTPFFFSEAIIDDDSGFGGSGGGSAGGASYSSLSLISSDTLSADVTLPSTLSTVVPVTLTGTVQACSTRDTCFLGSGTRVFDIAFSVHGLLTLSANPKPDLQADIVFAQFTQTPEPAPWLLSISGIAFFLLRFKRRAAR